LSEKVFISGSISVTSLPAEVFRTINTIESKNIHIIIGDAKGIDKIVQEKLSRDEYYNVTVYTIYNKPRNIISQNFNVKQIDYDKNLKSEREKQKFKDLAMVADCDYALVIWDGKSKGSYNNILNALNMNKLFKVFYTKANCFLKKEEKTLQAIQHIYRQNTGYTITELFDELKRSNLASDLKNTVQLKDYLINLNVLQNEHNVLKPTENYKNYFIEEQYKGSVRIKYTPEVLSFFE